MGQLLQFPAGAAGLDQWTDERHVEPSQLIEGENLRFRKRGRFGKRYGTVSVSESSPGVSGDGRIWTADNRVLVTSGLRLCDYSANAGNGNQIGFLQDVGALPRALVTTSPVWTGTDDPDLSNDQLVAQDIASSPRYRVAVWISGGTLLFEAVDTSTGTPLGFLDAYATAGAASAKVAYLATSGTAGVFLIAYAKTGSAGIYYYVFSEAAGSVNSGTLIAAHLQGTDFGLTATDRFIVAAQIGANYDPTFYSFNSSLGALVGATTMTEALAVQKYGMQLSGSSADNVWIAYTLNSGGTEYVRGGARSQSALTSVVAATTVATSTTFTFTLSSVQRASSTKAFYSFTRQETATGIVRTRFASLDTSATVLTLASADLYWSKPASRLFQYDSTYVGQWVLAGGAFVGAAYAGSLDPPTPFYSFVLVLLDTTNLSGSVSRVPHGLAAMRGAAPGTQLPSVVSVVGGQWMTALFAQRDAFASRALTLLLADFRARNRWIGAEYAYYLALSGGCNTIYDGRRLLDLGFAYDIQGPVSSTAAGGGSLAAATYTYVFVYSRKDARGNILRGATSAPIDVAANLNDQITHVLPTLSYSEGTSENGLVQIEVYRNTPSLTGSTDIYYYLGKAASDFFDGTVSFVDSGSIADAVLATRPRLYTTGGNVDNVCPPGGVAVVAHQDRLLVLEQHRVWYSKIFVDAEAPAFADEFTVDVPGDRLVGGVSLEDRAILFGERYIWQLVGAGPNDAAQGGDYLLQRVTTDLGCSDARSIVLHPDGVFFRSGVGIYNLSKTGAVEYAGRFVEDELGQQTTIQGVTVHPFEHTVILQTSADTRLVWDYMHKQWLRDTMSFSMGGCVAARGSMWTVDATTGELYVEQGYKDDGVWVTMRAKFGFAKQEGLLGYQNEKRFGVQCEAMSSHGLRLRLFNNYSSTHASEGAWTDSEVAALPGHPLYAVSVANTQPLTKGVSLEVTDLSSGSGSGEGAALLGVAIDRDPQEGMHPTAGVNRR